MNQEQGTNKSTSENQELMTVASSSDSGNSPDSGASKDENSGAYAVDAPKAPPLVILRNLSEPMGEGHRREMCVGRNNKGVTWGAVSEQGRRKAMEDATVVVPALLKVTCEQFGGCTAPATKYSTKESPVHFFGVFDGHGGSQVSTYCARRINEVLAEEWVRECETYKWSKSWESAFCSTFEKVDNVLKDETIAPSTVGSTALVVVLSPCQILAAHCGDSRAILCRGTRTIPLTFDHKPDREDETLRITSAGGRIFNWHGLRVEGVLSMTRAIGDHNLKQSVISVPEISVMTREKDDDFLVLASDGLWEAMSNDEVVNFTRNKMREKRRLAIKNNLMVAPAQLAATDLLQTATYRGSMDNISIIIVDLKWPKRKVSTY